jgi:FixJ family two-component response regulator
MRRQSDEALGQLRARFELLTPRERAVLVQVAQGRLNKQIAGDLGITETTVKVHRSHMMRKIGAASVPQLCRMVDELKLLKLLPGDATTPKLWSAQRPQQQR